MAHSADRSWLGNIRLLAPDAALAVPLPSSWLLGGGFSEIAVAQGVAIPLCCCWSLLDYDCHALSSRFGSQCGCCCEKGDIKGWTLTLSLSSCKDTCAILPFLLMIPAESVKSALEAMPAWLSEGMQINWWYGRSRWLCHSYQRVGNSWVWPFFAIGFSLWLLVSGLPTLIALGANQCAIALIYLALSKRRKWWRRDNSFICWSIGG